LLKVSTLNCTCFTWSIADCTSLLFCGSSRLNELLKEKLDQHLLELSSDPRMPSLLCTLQMSFCTWSPDVSLKVSKFTGLKSLMLYEPFPISCTMPFDLEHLGELEELESFGLVLTKSWHMVGFPTLKVCIVNF
jgi:hypothetical protein